jgi:hypothetical protein
MAKKTTAQVRASDGKKVLRKPYQAGMRTGRDMARSGAVKRNGSGLSRKGAATLRAAPGAAPRGQRSFLRGVRDGVKAQRAMPRAGSATAARSSGS